MHKLAMLIFSLVMIIYTAAYANNSGGSIVCKQPYALCTTATCVPMPGDKNKSLCFCNVFDGYSTGSLSCAKRKPYTGPHGNQHIVSTFSFEDYATNKAMTCPSGKPWAFCLDKPCQIDPRNSNQAICACDIMTKGASVTLGGQCNTSTCDNTLYSAASASELDGGTQALMKAMKLTESPVRVCGK